MFFSAKIWFLVLFTIKSFCETSLGFNTDLDNFNNFIAELEDTSGTFDDFVIKTEAIFCPERFNCSVREVESRKNILTQLPKDVRIRNESVKIEDMKHLVGVCCSKCSCSDTCFKIGNCCPTKLVNSNNSENTSSIDRHNAYPFRQNIGDVLIECIAASVKSYRNKAIKKLYKSFFMITKCVPLYSNSTLEQNCINPSAYSRKDVGPVTSKTTRLTYWNSHCAECNNDNENTIPWQAHIEFDRDIIYFSNMSSFTYPASIEELYAEIALSHAGDIIYTPPVQVENQMCLRKCNEMPLNGRTRQQIINGSNFLMEACQVFNNPVFVRRGFRTYLYRNIYCFLSQQMQLDTQKEEQECRIGEYFKDTPPQMTALLDYGKTPKTSADLNFIGQSKLSQRKCPCDKIFDHYTGVCRQLYCPAGEFLIGCRCNQPLINLSGMPVLLVLKVTPKNGYVGNISRTKMEGYQNGLRDTLYSTTDHIFSEMCATFRGDSPETNYFLSLALVRSKPGWDTKQAMKPFMKYLDTTRYMHMRNSNVMHDAKVSLTSKVSVSSDYNKNLRRKDVRVSDLEFKKHKLSLFYSSATAFADLNRLLARKACQVLSPLLYCTQIQFSEFFLRDGSVIINTNSHNVSLKYYYMVDQNKVRVCASHYIHELANLGTNLSNRLHFLVSVCILVFMFM